MNIDESIRTHTEVRDLLRSYMARSAAHSMGLFAIGRAVSCPLGEWIHKHRVILAGLPEYQTLVVVHQEFHVVAHEVLKLAMAGKNDEATALLEGQYADAEAALGVALRALGDTQQD